MSYTSKGTIVVIKDTQHISDSFQKREFVLEIPEDNPQYTNVVQFEVIKDKCDVLNSFQVGQEVEVSWNLKGRKWDSPTKGAMYFNTLQVWKINATSQQGAPPAYQQAPQPSFDDTPQSEEIPF
jgi:hypothetical protein